MHTEGPWERIDNADYAEIHTVGPYQLRSSMPIALVGKPEDADLIAAAPDMFKAIRWCLDRDYKNGSLPEAYAEALRSSISKATA